MKHSGRFAHEKLDAYWQSRSLTCQAKTVAAMIPTGFRKYADQLIRSAGSVSWNVAEGANKATAGQKRQRYSDARGEAGEVAALCDVLSALQLVDDAAAQRLYDQADRVAAMLTRLIVRFSR